MPIDWIMALVGGLLIGLSVTLMLWLNGRVTGIAGIIYGLFNPAPGDRAWRWYFIGGLLLGGVAMNLVKADSFANELSTTPLQAIIAGLLVGFGTILGSGCTSGHGVCGLSRFSIRSLVSTLIFMLFGVLIVYVLRHGLGVAL